MSTTTLHRELFTTRRTLEYFTDKELAMQLGAPRHRWGLVLVKELLDNAMDACETARIDPVIGVVLSPDGFTIEDNGPGMSPELIETSLDYHVRISDKTYYISPSHGQLGNALKCLWAAPFVLNPESPGVVRVTSQGLQHTVQIGVDRIAQEPRIEHRTIPFVKTGTTIEVELACCSPLVTAADFYKSVADLIETYAACNPHVALSLQSPEGTTTYPATSPDWRKWLPSDPTSPHWYTPDDLTNLLAAMLNLERLGRRARTIREVVAEFHGLSASAKQKAVLEDVGLSREYLKALVDGDDLAREKVASLLAAMQRQARPVNPKSLGVLGQAHLTAVLDAHEATLLDYRVGADVDEGLPYVCEVAVGVYNDHASHWRRVITGVNWAGAFGNPFGKLELWLNQAMVQRGDAVLVLVHVAIPRPTFADRSKQTLALPEAIGWMLESLVTQATKRWTQAKRAAIKADRAEERAEERLRKQQRQHYPTIKDAAACVMPEAHQRASGDGTYAANARQVYYAAREPILKMIHPEKARKGLSSQYFIQTVLVDYMREHAEQTASWDIVFDDRGHFLEPHRQAGRERRIGLGTLAVRNYIRSWRHNIPADPHIGGVRFDLGTSGPTNRFRFALFIEKEGFDPLLEQAQIFERYDLAPMSTKGMSVTACRQLVEALTQQGVTILVLHDFDKSGFTILDTLRSDTRRYQYRSKPNVIDLGLSLADAQAMQLLSEPVTYKQSADPKADLRRHGASEEECAFLVRERRRRYDTDDDYWTGERIELNAMTSVQFLAYLEAKLDAAGVHKLVPNDESLAAAYRNAWITAATNQKIAQIRADLPRDITVPDDLRERLTAVLAEHPAWSWDEALFHLMEDADGGGDFSRNEQHV